MRIIYEKPQIVFSVTDMESVQRTKELINELAYGDQDMKIFDVAEDDFNYEDLFNVCEWLRRICERAIVREDEND